MIAHRKNLVLDKGATFVQTFRYKDAEGNPLDISGWTGVFRMVNRIDGQVILSVPCDLSPVEGENGYIALHIPDEETALLMRGELAYALELEDPQGDIHRLLFGLLEVRTVAGE